MIEESFNFITADTTQLFVNKWLPDSEIVAVLLLVHGSVEHASRYKHFAEFLTKNNIAVYAPDLRGHGQTVKLNGEYSCFADKDGWSIVVNDLKELKHQLSQEYENKPFFLFGHSMGSILVRDLISKDGNKLNGAIVMGSTFGKFTLTRIGLLIINFLLLFRKSSSKSPFFHDVLYGKLNRTIINPRTNADFISRDEVQVQKYLDDPLNGITITLGYAQQLAKGSLKAAKKEVLNSTPKDLPILILSGRSDPVGGEDADEVVRLYKAYKKSGKTRVVMKLYDGARHELLNEINRYEVMGDILNWMENRI